jgi:hypothetical protein
MVLWHGEVVARPELRYSLPEYLPNMRFAWIRNCIGWGRTRAQINYVVFDEVTKRPLFRNAL